MRPSLLVLALLAAFGGPVHAEELERVTIVVGRGQLRSVTGLETAEFRAAMAGTNPLLTLSRLPGAYFQSADAQGSYEWSTRFALRSFAQSQLGFTLDDVPLGDMSYGNHNGLHISRAIASENIARADLSQGSGALDTASSSNLGGTVQFYSLDPLPDFRVLLQQSLGSDAWRRSHVRLDSGNQAWGRLALSLTDQETDKWKGQGEQRHRQWNFKWMHELGSFKASAFLNHSDRQEVDYQDHSLEMLNRLGWTWDNSYPDLNAALQRSTTLCGNAGSTYVRQCDDAYYAGSGLRRDTLGAFKLQWQASPDLQARATLYHHDHEGGGLWFTPYVASPDGTPLSIRTTEYAIERHGLVASLEGQWQAHRIKLGLWLEDNDFDQARRFYAVNPAAPPSPYVQPSSPFRTDWIFHFRTRTAQVSLADTWALSPDINLGLGFRALRVQSDAEVISGSNRPQGRVLTDEPFLPQVGLNWELDRQNEVYASLARNARAFQASAAGTAPFATTAAGFEAIRNQIRPERSDSFELGWRGLGLRHQASLTLYTVRFHDRLLSVQAGSAIQGNPSVLSNVGGVSTHGLEAALSARLNPQWTVYAGLSLSRARYRDDVVSGTTRVATAGKQVVDHPSRMLKAQLGYDEGPWSWTLGLDAQSQRYYSYTNDAKVPGRALLNGSLAYRLGNLGALQDARLRLSVSNLGQRRHIATLGSNGFVNSDPSGLAQTLLPGAPRQALLSFSARL